MKKYLLFESLSQSLSNKASNTQSFKVANKPGRSNGWKHLVLLFMFMVTMLGSYAQYSQSIVTGATSGATVNPITNVTASITDGSGITQTENYSSGSGGLNFGTGNSSGGFGADGSTSATITNADANGHYITYAISPASGYALSISGISVSGKQSGTGTANYQAVSYATSTSSFPASATYINAGGNAPQLH